MFQGLYPSESTPGYRQVLITEFTAPGDLYKHFTWKLRKLDISSKTDIRKTAWVNA